MIEEKLISQKDLEFDRNHLWHPYTSLENPLPTYAIDSAAGVRLILNDGRSLIDGMASWWTAIHGYNVPELNKAAEDQLKKMSHVMFGGITHEPAIKLGQKLVELSPNGLNKVFFADSGSVSVEVALKMALQFQNAKGFNERKKFLTFKKGYHGDTTGAMSVCDPVSGMHSLFNEFMPEHFFIQEPYNGFERKVSMAYKKSLEYFFKRNADKAAAFILEPIVQGAGGMRIYSPDYLKLVRELCTKHGLLLIADEIATGFGRTGKMFAVEHAQIKPDILCVGKAMTGGYLTMAATICSEEVAKTISESDAGVMMHGPTFMGNPLACAISRKSLDLLTDSDWKGNVKRLELALKNGLIDLKDHPLVEDVRILGAIGVVETKKEIDVALAQKFFVDEGVWIRPFRNLIYIMPPYIMSNEDLEIITNAMRDILNQENVFK